jgi:hypothetical protein
MFAQAPAIVQTVTPFLAFNYVPATPGATPAIPLKQGILTAKYTLTANATPAVTPGTISAGQIAIITVCPTASGYTWAWPSSFVGATPISGVACVTQKFYSPDGSTLTHISTGNIAATPTASGCVSTITATTSFGNGGATIAGAYTSATTGTCTEVITSGLTVPHGMSCRANDLTTTTDSQIQTATTTTTVTISGTTVSGDIINFACQAY